MDLLFTRYASPYLLVDELIKTGRLSEFVDELVDWKNKENEEKIKWDIYLHKVFNQSYQEFIDSAEENKQEDDNNSIMVYTVEAK